MVRVKYEANDVQDGFGYRLHVKRVKYEDTGTQGGF